MHSRLQYVKKRERFTLESSGAVYKFAWGSAAERMENERLASQELIAPRSIWNGYGAFYAERRFSGPPVRRYSAPRLSRQATEEEIDVLTQRLADSIPEGCLHRLWYETFDGDSFAVVWNALPRDMQGAWSRTSSDSTAYGPGPGWG